MPQVDWMHYGWQRCDSMGVWVSKGIIKSGGIEVQKVDIGWKAVVLLRCKHQKWGLLASFSAIVWIVCHGTAYFPLPDLIDSWTSSTAARHLAFL